MKDNMRQMAEREVQLSDLQGKSSHLQTASNSFSRQAVRLRREQEWQRYRMVLVGTWIAMFLLWTVLFFALKGRRKDLLKVGGALVATLGLGTCLLVMRHRSDSA